MFSGSQYHVDCVLCHHDSPRIDGVEALTTLREVDPTLARQYVSVRSGKFRATAPLGGTTTPARSSQSSQRPVQRVGP